MKNQNVIPKKVGKLLNKLKKDSWKITLKWSTAFQIRKIFITTLAHTSPC